MVGPSTFVFQPTLLDCWACRDLKRFRQILKGAGGITITQAAPQWTNGSVGKGDAAGSPSTSQGKSPAAHTWGSAGNSFSAMPCSPSEVNRRDHLGRTVLHLIAASTEPVSIDYLVALLAHPSVNVNLQDHENGWTALHRALYHGNLLTALTLLKRSPPSDVRVKDFEGLTPFDLYNSTVHGTNPPPSTAGEVQAGELFTWGANRNFTLGIGTSDDRNLPDRVNLRHRYGDESPSAASSSKYKEPGAKFDKIQARDVGMSKFATVVLTSEKSSNVWVCGIGNTGRIGRAPQTQPNLEPLRDFSECATAISVGPDHTCILTSAGDVYTFGFNRFLQLGYALEQGQGIVSSSTKGTGGAASTTFGGSTLSNTDLDVQISPRKVAGVLKKEFVLGVAAGKLHSAAFTSDALYTWGTNTGQLGYDRAATPLQIVPRKVAAITSSMSIQSIAVSDFATACLLASGDVMLLHNDAAFFVRFPQLTFSSQASVYRPRQARPKPSIQRIVAGPNNSFAAISDIGDLWQFTPEHPAEYSQSSGTSTAAKATIKPQLIWSVRKNKKVGAARDVAIGQGQDLILVTESGHVFVRTRKGDLGSATQTATLNAGSGGGTAQPQLQGSQVSQVQQQHAQQPPTLSVKGKSGWKFVPFLQRVVRVATNESGGLAAIKCEARIREVRIRGRSLQDDLRDALPHLKAPSSNVDREGNDIVGEIVDAAAVLDERPADLDGTYSTTDSEDSDHEDAGAHYINMAQVIAEAARRWLSEANDQQSQSNSLAASSSEKLPLGCDMFVVAANRHLPAHRSIVSARLPMLANALSNPPTKGTGDAPASVIIRRRPGEYTTMSLERCSFGAAVLLLHYLYTDDLPPIWTASIGLRVEKVFAGLKMPASVIHAQMKQLADALELQALKPSLNSPIPLHPKAQLSTDMSAFFMSNVDVPVDESRLHDVELRFADDKRVPCHSVILRRSPFFSTLLQPHWTSSRWHDDMLSINMTHTRWEVARIVLQHLYTDKLVELFADSDADRTQDQFIDFVVETLAFSNELLLDKFKLACCALLRKRVIPTTVGAMMTNADFYHASSFKDSVMDYASRTMETLLESGLLDDLEHRMIKDLTRHVRQKQDDRLNRTRASEYINSLVSKHNDYYFDLDIPAPSLGIAAARVPKRQPRLTGESRQSPALEALGSTSHSLGRPIAAHLRDSSSPNASPNLRPTSRTQGHNAVDSTTVAANDESMMFDMDDDDDIDNAESGKRGQQKFALPPPAASSATTASPAPWRSRTAEAQKAQEGGLSPLVSATRKPEVSTSTAQDLRSIMALEESKGRPFAANGSSPAASLGPNLRRQSQISTLPTAAGSSTATADQFSWSVSGSNKLSQKDRKRQQQQQQQQQAETSGSMSSSTAAQPLNAATSPWKPVTGATPSRPSLLATQTTPASSAASPLSGSASSRAPSFGPTYTPTRSRPFVPRRGVSGAGGPDGGSLLGTSASSIHGVAGASPGGTGSAWASSSVSYASFGTSPTNRAEGGPGAWQSNASSANASPLLGPVVRGGMTPSNGQRAPLPSRLSFAMSSSTDSSTLGTPSTSDKVARAATDALSGEPSASPSPARKSFAEIQAEEIRQLEAIQALQSRAPKSFAELQEEDRRDNERKVKEERERLEFEKWFEEERKRIKKEEEQQKRKNGGRKSGGGGGAPSATTSTGQGSKPRGGKGKEASEQSQVISKDPDEPSTSGQAHANANGGRRGGGPSGRRARAAGSHTDANDSTGTAPQPNGQSRQNPSRGGRGGQRGGGAPAGRGRGARERGGDANGGNDNTNNNKESSLPLQS